LQRRLVRSLKVISPARIEISELQFTAWQCGTPVF
jgi:hypothetical protein